MSAICPFYGNCSERTAFECGSTELERDHKREQLAA